MIPLLLLLLAADAPERITRPDWAEKPTAADLEAFYPADARMREIEGRATIECVVTVEGPGG